MLQRRDDTAAPAASPAVNKATVRVLTVLAFFVERPGAHGVTEISRALAITKNMAFRALRTLCDQGFVVRRPDGPCYELGYAALWLRGPGLDREPDIRDLCRPFLRQLHDLTGESVFLSVIVGRNHVTIDSVESHGVRVSHNPRGLLVPLHASPASRVLLAALTDAEIEAYIRAASPLRRFTDTTITEPAALREEVALVRRNGFARGYGDHYAHATYVSFPVLGVGGRPHAAVTVGAPKDRMSDADVERLLPGMQRVMAALNLQSRLHPTEPVVRFD